MGALIYSVPISALIIGPRGWFLVIPFVGLAVLCLVKLFRARFMVKMLRDRSVRVIHGLEHATLAILREGGHVAYAGGTLADRFFLVVGGRTSPRQIANALQEAIRRFRAHDTTVAYSRTCGTVTLVAMALFAVIIMGGFVAFAAFDVPLAWSVLFALIAQGVASERLGLLVQRVYTVSTRFTEVHLGNIAFVSDATTPHLRFDVPLTVTV